MVSICMVTHIDKTPFESEAAAKEHCERTNTRQRQTIAVHRAGYSQRTDRALRTLNAYLCSGCGLWFVGTVKPGAVDNQASLQKTAERHKRSHEERRRLLATSNFNTPRLTRTTQ